MTVLFSRLREMNSGGVWGRIISLVLILVNYLVNHLGGGLPSSPMLIYFIF